MKTIKMLLILAGTLLLLTACGKAPEEILPGETEPEQDHGAVTAVTFARGHMVQTESFRFSLEEKDGDCFLNADYFNEQEEKTVIEGQKVSGTAMEELRKLLEEKNVLTFAETWEKPGHRPAAQDETIFELEIRLEDGTVLKAESHGTFGEDLRIFFTELCENSEASD